MILSIDWIEVAEKLAEPESPLDARLRNLRDSVNEFTRARMREDGFFRRIMPPMEISNEELDRAVSTDEPVTIVDSEPNSNEEPAGISIPFGTLPTTTYIRDPRYAINFDLTVNPTFNRNVYELGDVIRNLEEASLRDIDRAIQEAVSPDRREDSTDEGEQENHAARSPSED